MGRHADVTGLEVSTARLLKAASVDIVLERTSPEDAAVVVLSQPTITDALEAAVIVTELRALHHSGPRVAGSHDIVCRHCRVGWPCRHAEILGVTG